MVMVGLLNSPIDILITMFVGKEWYRKAIFLSNLLKIA
jgi:hypothetical protein